MGCHEYLIIDDDPGTLETFEFVLRVSGFEVATASTGREALNLVSRSLCDVVLCDLCLPDITGVEILRTIRNTGALMPFVMMTGFGSVSSAVEAMKLGACSYLEKPLTEVQVVAAVQAAAASSSDVAQLPSNPSPADSPAAKPDEASSRGGVPINWLAAEALRIIGARYREHGRSTRAVARELGVTTEHLCRLLRREAGVGFVVHLHRTRVEEAKRLLSKTSLSIKEVAFRVGYATTARLDHHFKRLVGVLPTAFRKSSGRKDSQELE